MPNAFRCTAVVSATVALLALLSMNSAHDAEAASERGRYIIVLADSVEYPAAVAERQAESRGGDIRHVYRHAIKGYSAELPKTAVEGLRNNPRVKSVTPDHVLRLFAQSMPTGINRIFAPANEALAVNEEDDLRIDADVAVIDSGVDAHEDLNVVGRTDCATAKEGTFECVNGIGADYVGHGTHVAGTIGALDNSKGVVGVAPGARIWSVRIYLFNNIELFESSAIAGVDWVAGTREDGNPKNDIDVANMSFGCYEKINCPSGLPALDAAITEAVADGVVMVAAAGNAGEFKIEANHTHPAAHPDVITVSAAADSDGQPGGKGPGGCTENFSSHGTRSLADDTNASFSNYGSAVEVAAPGVCILSTYPGNQYRWAGGTSMAAPHVAGAAAILAGQDQPESKEDVEAIRSTIVEEGNSGWTDTSPDGIKEPLLDVGDESVFNFRGPPTITTKPASNVVPAKATLSGTIHPNGSETSYQFEYGTNTDYGTKVPASPKAIGSSTSPVAVSEGIAGLEPETTYHFRLVATNAEGTTKGSDQTFTTPKWEIVSTPNPEGASHSHLNDVSCEPSSTNSCTAVGFSTPSSGLVANPIAQRWNGTSWSEQGPAVKSGATVTHLLGVDCPSASRCIAVGKSAGSGGSSTTLAELWNENKWSVQSTPVPSGSNSSELVAVGCNSTASCVAVGSAFIGGNMTAIAERWASPTWSLESIPIPSGANWSKLSGVDCIWSNFCVAVGSYAVSGGSGKSYAMFWNGTSWSLQSLPVFEGTHQSTLLDVSCTPSPNRCMAVGWWTNSLQNQFTLAYRFDGSTWTLQSTPNPSGAIHSFFEDVSCATETSCTAVGGWLNGLSGLTTLAEKWNGTSWSVQSTLNPTGSIFSVLAGTSCRGASCIAVGRSADASEEVETTLAEVSDSRQSPIVMTKSATNVESAKVTLKGAVNPNGLETSYQFEYGTTSGYGSKIPASPKAISSGTSPVAVSDGIEGLKPDTTYHFRLVATNAKGTTEGPDQIFTTPAWKTISTPNPSGASDSNLYDVSCEPSTNVCTSVGKSTVSGEDRPVAQRWNGISWSEQNAAKKSGTLPTRLFGVDCPSETRCLAAGNYQPSEGGPTLLTEIWNEGKWSVQSPPVPSEATSSELVAIGCNSTAQCRAAGSAVIGGVKTAVVEAWTSPTWTLQTVPIPEGATSSQLDGIDCIWSSVCVAVGRYTAEGSTKSLAMLWNGTNWALQTLTAPEGAVQTTLLDVSCTPSPTRCTAVGGWKNATNQHLTLAYRFNGSTWTLQITPNPFGATESVLEDVSCATETSCTAGGSSNSGGSTQTLAERWNGSSWSVQGTSNPSGAAFSSLFGVSCRSTTCMGVGWSTDGSGVDTTLGEIRE